MLRHGWLSGAVPSASLDFAIKSNTLINIDIWAMIRGKDEAVIAYRKLSNEVIKKSFIFLFKIGFSL